MTGSASTGSASTGIARLDQKGAVVDLIQRNTEVSIPFLVSSLGYGFLWNHPGIGRVELGTTATRWVTAAAPLELIPVYVRGRAEPYGPLASIGSSGGESA